jgi:hypothetical protein
VGPPSQAHPIPYTRIRGRATTRAAPLPGAGSDLTTDLVAFLSLTASLMLPATIALWLGLEIAGFAMIYVPGMANGDFVTNHRLPLNAATAFYLSAGDITSLVFGDVDPKTALWGALTTLETIVGLGTLTLAFTYVLTALGVLDHIDRLHGRVRRNAEDPELLSSVLTRHFRSPSTSQLTNLLQALTDDLDRYDQGLRRYPVVYYFHTRRIERSVPRCSLRSAS